MGLVTWIGIYIYVIEDLLHYLDDTFMYNANPVLEYYGPHDTHYPSKQCQLTLWDDIGLPHEPHKQVFGQCLNIIGFFMNPIDMSFIMPAESKNDLINAIFEFIDTSSLHQHLLVE